MLRPSPLLLCLLLASCVSGTTWRPGVELQAYPAGVIASVQGRQPLDEGAFAFLRAGYNFTDRRDFGEHDDESGGGAGIGIGYRQELAPAAQESWLWGARVDLWFLEVDWKDAGEPGGVTDVVVLQPAGEIGYRWQRHGGSSIELAASLGAEINVDTDGEDVGEGLILLVGLTYLF